MLFNARKTITRNMAEERRRIKRELDETLTKGKRNAQQERAERQNRERIERTWNSHAGLLKLQREIGLRAASPKTRDIQVNQFGQLTTAPGRHLEAIFGKDGEHAWAEVEKALRNAGMDDEQLISKVTQPTVNHAMMQAAAHRIEAEAHLRNRAAQAEQGVRNAESDAEFARSDSLQRTAAGIKEQIQEWKAAGCGRTPTCKTSFNATTSA